MAAYPKLFEPIRIGKVRIKNRIAMAPMGIVGLTNPDGNPGPRGIDYYVERAKARALLDMLGGKSISVKRTSKSVQKLIEEEQTLLRKIEFLDDEEQKRKVFIAYQEVLAKIKEQYPEYVTLKAVEPVDLRTLQKGLDSETIILEYFLCHRGVYLFAIDNKGVSAQKLYVSPEELYRDVEKFRMFILGFDQHP